VFDAQMRLTTELPAIDHAATVVRPAAGTTASASGAGGGIDGDVPRQIVQAIRLQWSQGVGTARVTLQPDYLGDMSIDIRVDRGAVTAVLDASNASVRQWLEGHEPLLRQSLADQGLTLDRLVVKDEQTPSGTGGDERQKREQGESEPRPRSRRDAQADATFEVVM
jgi:flagellar hook-length control protein FliK